MAYFMVRVELHSATPDDYTTLHAAMEAAGFSRTIRDSDGKHYDLPSGLYFLESYSETAAKILDRADAAATRTRKSHGVIVTEGTSTWRGLQAVRTTNALSSGYFR